MPTTMVTNPEKFVSNVVIATGHSISQGLGEIAVSSAISEWLEQQSNELLEAIAAFLNLSKKPADPAFDIVNPNQLPEVSEEAVNFVLDMIDFSINNPDFSIQSGGNTLNSNDTLNFDSFNDFQNFLDTLNNPTSDFENILNDDGTTERKNFTFNFLGGIFSHTIKVEVETVIPDANSCECMTINGVTTILIGNTTLFEWEQIGDYRTEISNDGSQIKVIVRGLKTTGVKISGFPFRTTNLVTFILTFNHSTGNTIDYIMSTE